MPQRSACALIALLATTAPVAAAAAAAPSTQIVTAHYATLAKVYRENRWTLLNGIAAPDFQFVQVDGTAKRLADLERDAETFAKQGGRITTAAVQVVRTSSSAGRVASKVRVTLDVALPRAGRFGRMLQVDDDSDTWSRHGARWLLTRSAVASEAITQFGPVASVPASPLPRTAPPNLGRFYATIDRAFRESDWTPVQAFAAPNVRFTEVDGSVKTLDQLSAGGKAFFNAGGRVAAAHVRVVHVIRRGDRASVAAVATATGSYPAGAQRMRFMQHSEELDDWERSGGRWLYRGGRVLRQTITTFANR